MLHPLAVFSFLFLLFLIILDFDKVLNDGEDTPATEEVYHHFTPSPFQTNLKEEDYKPIVKKPIEVPENPVDPSRYAGHSLMKRILEAEKEQQQQEAGLPAKFMKWCQQKDSQEKMRNTVKKLKSQGVRD